MHATFTVTFPDDWGDRQLTKAEDEIMDFIRACGALEATVDEEE